MHKTVTTLALALLFTLCATAQDLITKRTGEDIMVKVTEIDSPVIKYKLLDALDGPAYVIRTSEIFSIKFFGGKKIVYGATIPPPVTAPVPIATATTQYDSLMKLANSNKAGSILGFVTGPLFVIGGTTLIALGTLETNTRLQTLDYALGGIVLAGGVAEFVLGGVCLNQYHKQKAAAQKLKGTAYLHLPAPYATARGGGVSWRITF